MKRGVLMREMSLEASMCAWCGKMLQSPDTAWVVRAKSAVKRPDPEYEGQFVPLKLAKNGRTITGFLVTSDSPTEQGDIEVVFVTCGPKCTLALKTAVREEAESLGLVIS